MPRHGAGSKAKPLEHQGGSEHGCLDLSSFWPFRLFIGFASDPSCQSSPSLNGFDCAGVYNLRGLLDELHFHYGLSVS